MPTLTHASQDNWLTTGRLVVRSAFDAPTLNGIETAVDRVARWADNGGPGLHHFEMTDDGRKLARSEDFEPHERALSGVLRHGVIVDVLTELFGESPTLFKEKINYKHPGGAGFAPHQDATAYRFVDHHISVMIPVDAATVASGCLWFCNHVPEILPNEAGRIDPVWVVAQRWEPIEVAPGDVVFFDSYAPHYSETNNSRSPRRALYVTYNRASAGDFRAAYYADKQQVLAEAGNGNERLRISVNDDFLGRPA